MSTSETFDSVVKEISEARIDHGVDSPNAINDSRSNERKDDVKGEKKNKPKKVPKEKNEVQKPIAKKKEVKKDTGLGLSVKKMKTLEIGILRSLFKVK